MTYNDISKCFEFYIACEKLEVLDQIKKEIKAECSKSFREIRLKISLFNLFQENVSIAKMAIMKPLEIVRFLCEVCASTFDVVQKCSTFSRNSDFYINLKFLDVPPFDCFQITNSTNILPHLNSMTFFSGIIQNVTYGFSFIRSSTYVCTDQFCTTSHVIVNYPEYNYTESTNLRNVSTCKCGMKMLENLNDRIMENYCIFRVLLSDHNNSKQSGICKSVNCVARGDICQHIRTGINLQLIGYPILKGNSDKLGVYFEINNVIFLNQCSFQYIPWNKVRCKIPHEILSFECGLSLLMAFMFADDITVPGSYLLLKLLVLLLSLPVNFESNIKPINRIFGDELQSRPLSFLILSNEPNITSRITRAVARYKKYFYAHSDQDDLFGNTVTKECLVSEEIGSLQLPENYIVYLPNIEYLTKNQKNKLCKVLLDRIVQPKNSFNSHLAAGCNTKILNSSDKFSCILTVKRWLLCRVWAQMSFHKSSVAQISDSSLSLVINSFDIVYVTKAEDSETWWFNKDGNLKSDDATNDGIFNSFLDNATSLSILDWEPGSEQLIRGYYIIGRKFALNDEEKFPKSTISILLQFATNLARLNNRNTVSIYDCVLSICLCEIIRSSKTDSYILPLPDHLENNLTNVKVVDADYIGSITSLLTLFYKDLMKLIKANVGPMFFEE